ncbi:hypothetical protein QJU96_09545 [Pasteurella skyensis]|uniref:Uncharacterized protein n=1 Tax=Phocoenobacter skyensis TaxID=97481 RepID=A0AAJ6P368_9PAST|nr:hypothetical protein [Pasteurella skyensis]MDP8171523.1 hypothetical protein [Pasteurella skyensis]MDP8175425.1 hypothetical protein [Pasteurella skyensis]
MGKVYSCRIARSIFVELDVFGIYTTKCTVSIWNAKYMRRRNILETDDENKAREMYEKIIDIFCYEKMPK